MITQQDLHELLDYDANTGVFCWKKKRRGIQVNKPLGTNNGFGYLRITVMSKSYYAHRLAWMYVHGNLPYGEIDHINGIKDDNRIENLRDLQSISNANNKTKANKRSKSKILGVSWHKKANKWAAFICVYKERKYLGLFSDIKQAETAYQLERQKIQYFEAINQGKS
jgi:hypothetical protein